MQQSVLTEQRSESAPHLIELEAVRRAQSGDAAAFEHLYKVHSRRVYAQCLRMLRNTGEAEDLTQQIFMQMFRKIGTFRSEGRVSTWLHRIAVNAVLMHWRRKRPYEFQVNDTDDPPVGLGSPHPSLMGTVDRVSLIRAIHNLPRTRREKRSNNMATASESPVWARARRSSSRTGMNLWGRALLALSGHCRKPHHWLWHLSVHKSSSLIPCLFASLV